jgi:hypothetical protein
METAWVFETLAITVARIDFWDPALADDPHARERGVRVEVRPVEQVSGGSVYASPIVTMQPAVCRIDLLESRPGAADRMHWHPVMDAGEPCERVFDATIPSDPTGWLEHQLRHVEELLGGAGVDVARHSRDVAAVADRSGEILASANEGLAWAREPWPVVRHDERGMAIA